MSARKLLSANIDTDLLLETDYFVINSDDRTIIPPSTFKYFGVESDENSNRIYFKCPQTVGDNIDLTTLNLRVNYKNANGEKDYYLVDDVTYDGEYIYFSWLLSRKCTQYKGDVNFVVCAVKTDSKGIVTNEWHTTLATGTVLEGLEVENPGPTEEVIDAINQLLDITKNAVDNVKSAEQTALENVEIAKSEALQYIGNGIDSTLKVSNLAADSKTVGDKLETKANAIVVTKSGSSIVVTDSAKSTLKSLKVFGKSTQDGAPTLDAPIDIVSMENVLVKLLEKNLLKITTASSSQNGVIFTMNSDGTVKVSGTATADTYKLLGTIKCKGEHILSGCPVGGSDKSYFLYIQRFDGKQSKIDIGDGATFSSEDELQVLIAVKSGVAVDLTFEPMVRHAKIKDDDFRLYKEQSFVIPHTLYGIPVESGGNYVDDQGQHWLCDEIDLERGVHIKRVAQVVLDGSEHWYGGTVLADTGFLRYYTDKVSTLMPSGTSMGGYADKIPMATEEYKNETHVCLRLGVANSMIYIAFPETTFESVSELKEYLATNNVTVIYPLAIPVEIQLPNELLEKYEALYSNHHITTLINDSGAHMELSYAADTQEHIKQNYVPLSKYLTLEERVSALENR